MTDLAAQLRDLASRAEVLEPERVVGDLATLLLRALTTAAAPPPPAPDRDDAAGLLDAKAVGARLGVPEGAARDLMRRGDLPVVLVGRKYKRVCRADVDAYIARHRAVDARQVRHVPPPRPTRRTG
jgi:helix-turn-helix protein